ncbi:hypothetical protein [Methanimicrococcus blatticola]|nr:hypothetical protein [Methanimicrococcus blatticola]
MGTRNTFLLVLLLPALFALHPSAWFVLPLATTLDLSRSLHPHLV